MSCRCRTNLRFPFSMVVPFVQEIFGKVLSPRLIPHAVHINLCGSGTSSRSVYVEHASKAQLCNAVEL